jgi:hypothetical protein
MWRLVEMSTVHSVHPIIDGRYDDDDDDPEEDQHPDPAPPPHDYMDVVARQALGPSIPIGGVLSLARHT